MENIFSLKNKTIIVSGGYGHLGAEITNALADFGAQVIVWGRNREKFDSNFQGRENIYFQKVDVTQTKQIQKALEKAQKQFSKIDVLVNNASAIEWNLPENVSDSDWTKSLDGTVGSVFKCTREIIPYFEKNKGGKIINVASMYGSVAPNFSIYKNFKKFLNTPQYGAGKAGIIQLTKYFASYLANKNITVNCVSPGPFPSPEVQRSKGFIKNLTEKNMLGRIGAPEDLKGVFILLCSGASDFITAQNIAVDGGWTGW